MHRRLLFFAFFLVPAFAFSGNLEARLVIVGPGKPLYTHWGHIGIAIRDNSIGRDLFYDFGNFSFYAPNFYDDFMQGYMHYRSAVTSTGWFIEKSKEENTEVFFYPLNLSDYALEKLQNKLNWWTKPENSEYLYHYFTNNCSTIIRDILDEVTEGQIRTRSNLIQPQNFRYYARAGSRELLMAEILLHFFLGPDTDKPINDWELMFLPYEVARFVSNFEYVDEKGISRSLAGPKVILKENSSPPKAYRPHVIWPLLLLTGIIAAIAWCFFDGRRFGKLIQTLVILIPSIPGLILSYFIVFTNHSVTYGNINIWPALPSVLLALIPVYFSRMPRRQEIAAGIWTVNFAGLIIALFLRITGLTVQDSGAFWCFFAPLTLAASWPGFMLRQLFAGNLKYGVQRRSRFMPAVRFSKGFRFPFPRINWGRKRTRSFPSKVTIRRGKF